MDLTLRLNADFEKASKAFNDLADSSAETRKKMEAFSDSFQDKSIDNFINKQKLLQASLIGTRGETAAMQASVGNYQKEIERLIRSGLSPNSDAVQRLARAQQNLQKELDNTVRAKERKQKAIANTKKALKAGAVAVAGLAAGLIALTKKTAENANQFLNNSRIVGLCIEAYQELDYVMRMNGVENGKYMLNRLNRSIIDVKNDTGKLTSFLKEYDEELLSNLKTVEDNEQAFMLLMDAINRAPNEFAKAELAMKAFGMNGAQMALVAGQGAEGINELREQARQLGVISAENAQRAAEFNDAMYRLRAAAKGISQELTSQLLPALTNIVIRITNAIQRFGEFRARMQGVKNTIRDFVPVIASATGGVAAFVAVMKGTTYIKSMVAAIKSLKLITKTLTVAKTAATAVKAGFLALSGVGLIKLAGAAAAAGAAIVAINLAIRNARDSADEFNDTINQMELPVFNYMAEEIADLDVALTELASGSISAVAGATETANSKMEKSLRERLNLIEHTANQEKNININTMQQFLIQRAKLESDDWEERLAFLKGKQEILLEFEYLTGDERIAIEQAVQNAIQALQEETVEKAEVASKNMLSAYSAFFGGFSSLLGEAGKENRAFFVKSRLLAIVQAGINTALAITKTLATMPAPANMIKAVAVGVKGLAQKASIVRSMIPSAETGGRFIVPNSRGVDSTLLRVNQGEEAVITPRSMVGNGSNESFNFNFLFDGQVFAEIINKQARAGEYYELKLAGNY